VTEPVAITDPALIERLMLPNDAFLDTFRGLIAHFPAREWTEEAFERGLRYPWYRPERSYLLQDGEAHLLHELDPARRADVLARHVGPAGGRVPLLAIGSNAAPKNLAIKLAHHDEPDDREVLVLAGELQEVDVVAAAAVAVYGAMPATLAPSPGVAARAAVLLVTATQLTTLTWGEISYRLGRLEGAPFVVEDGFDGLELDAPLAFVSRWGAFAPDGEPVALAAIPAHGRTFRAWTQRELVDRAAEIVLGRADAEELTRALFASTGELAPRAVAELRAHAQPFEFAGWRPMAPDGTLARRRSAGDRRGRLGDVDRGPER
jgi:hypothetical protein